ncbi:tyrosine-type recombinase/integrase [Burkholderia ubonensis]|uniref:tyrosine-type recombinase/integrase n=1 Tax=Burkholderia ubonensis TaxID=101571 RepID=UPI001E2FA4CB|nr:tyrosine-type recombinase/integrase [Burkholderia ubonensis]
MSAVRPEIAPCRKNELLKLEWSRVDFDRAVLSLEPGDTKNGKRRVVPLNDEAMAALRDQREWVRVTVPRSPWVFAVASGGRMTTIQKGFCAACVRAGIGDFRGPRLAPHLRLLASHGGRIAVRRDGFARTLVDHGDRAIRASGTACGARGGADAVRVDAVDWMKFYVK